MNFKKIKSYLAKIQKKIFLLKNPKKIDLDRIIGSKKFQWGVIITILALSFLTTSIILIVRHLSLFTSDYDLGIQGEAARNFAFHLSFFSDVKGFSYLGDHFSPILAIVGFFFYIWDNAAILLLLQNIFIFSSIVIFFFLARKILKQNGLALIITLVYTTNTYLHSINTFQFHIETLAIPLLILFIFLIEKKPSRKNFILSIVLALVLIAIKEDVSLVIIGLGIWMILFKKRKRLLGLIILLMGIAVFTLAMGYVIPHFNPKENFSYFARYDFGETAPEIIKNFILHPHKILAEMFTPFVAKLTSLKNLMRSFAYLPIFSPLHLLIATVPIFYNTSAKTSNMFSYDYHYAYSTLPLLGYASIYGFKRVIIFLKKLNKVKFQIALIIITLFLLGLITTSIRTDIEKYKRIVKYHERTYISQIIYDEIKPKISEDKKILTGSNLQPHFLEYNLAHCPGRKIPNDKVIKEYDYVILRTKVIPWLWKEKTKKEEYLNFISQLRNNNTTIYDDHGILAVKLKK